MTSGIENVMLILGTAKSISLCLIIIPVFSALVVSCFYYSYASQASLSQINFVSPAAIHLCNLDSDNTLFEKNNGLPSVMAILEDYVNRKPRSVAEALHLLRVTECLKNPQLALFLEANQGEDFLASSLTNPLNWLPQNLRTYVYDVHGICVRQQDKSGMRVESEGHRDQLLHALAESGTSLKTPLGLKQSSAALEDLLRASIQRYESHAPSPYSLGSYALYLAPSSLEERKVFDHLLDDLMSSPFDAGWCHGIHKSYCVALVLNVHQQRPLLTTGGESRAKVYLKSVALQLTQSQYRDGAWRYDWAQGNQAIKAPRIPRLGDGVLVTGHHLEWLAIAPDNTLPSWRIQLGLAYLSSQLAARPVAETPAELLSQTHAVRAIALWHMISKASL